MYALPSHTLSLKGQGTAYFIPKTGPLPRWALRSQCFCVLVSTHDMPRGPWDCALSRHPGPVLAARQEREREARDGVVRRRHPVPYKREFSLALSTRRLIASATLRAITPALF
jgi:hypothetical protein